MLLDMSHLYYAAYKPGVEVYFSSDDVVIEKIDNYPREDLDAYVSSMKNLMSEFRKYFPDNLKLELKQCVPDYYSIEEYTKELDEIVADFELTEERIEKLRKGFKFNFKRDGKDDYTDDAKYEADLENLMKYSDGYLKLTKRRDFVRGPDKIVLFSNAITNGIDIGSTNVSKAKFWAGIGTFEIKDDLVFDRVMSPKQWNENSDDVIFDTSDLLDLPNFDKVPTFNKRFDFINK